MPSMEPTGNSFHEHSNAPGTRFAARLEMLPAVLDAVGSALRDAGMSAERIARCDLVLEELFRNTVLHGHGGDSDASVWVRVGDGCVCYEDEAPAFDPLTAGLPDGSAVCPVEEHRVGGLGLMLVRQLPARVEYAYRDGRNRLLIVP